MLQTMLHFHDGNLHYDFPLSTTFHVKVVQFGGTTDQNAANLVNPPRRTAGKRLLKKYDTLKDAIASTRRNGTLSQYTVAELQNMCHKGTELYDGFYQFMKRLCLLGQAQPNSKKTLMKNYSSQKRSTIFT